MSSRLRSQRGSALLLVVLLSGFMLVSFIAFSGVVRESIRGQSTSYVDDLIRLDQFRESYLATGSGSLPAGYFLDPNGAIRYGSYNVFSGSSQTVSWTKSGTLDFTRTSGAPFCYHGVDGAGFLDGCVTETGSLAVTSNTGSFDVSTLGGYSNFSISPVTSVTSSGVVLRIFREVGNAAFLEKILKQ